MSVSKHILSEKVKKSQNLPLKIDLKTNYLWIGECISCIFAATIFDFNQFAAHFGFGNISPGFFGLMISTNETDAQARQN